MASLSERRTLATCERRKEVLQRFAPYSSASHSSQLALYVIISIVARVEGKLTRHDKHDYRRHVSLFQTLRTMRAHTKVANSQHLNIDCSRRPLIWEMCITLQILSSMYGPMQRTYSVEQDRFGVLAINLFLGRVGRYSACQKFIKVNHRGPHIPLTSSQNGFLKVWFECQWVE